MKLLKTILGRFYKPITRIVHESWAVLLPRNYAHYLYRKNTNKKLNLKHPKNYYEKVQWLKIYSDIYQWTDLADKYKVREYIIQCGLGHILVKLYGVWEKAEEINFSSLPDKFVLKPNNCFGRAILVYDKNQLNFDETRVLLNKWVRERYGLISSEPHYWNIERRIIAEELLQDKSIASFSNSLIDYKFFCIHGEPKIILVLFNRNNMSVGLNYSNKNPHKQAFVYDLYCNLRPEIISGQYKDDIPVNLPKPKCLDEMIRICRTLSKPFPQVRVDLYEVNNRIYFGELTFTAGGNMQTFSPEYYLKLGAMMDLSKAKLRSKKFIV